MRKRVLASSAALALVASSDGSWLAVDRTRVTVIGPDGTHVVPARPGVLLFGAQLSADGARLLTGAERLDLASGTWEDLPVPGPFLDGLDQRPSGSYEIERAAWDGDGQVLAAWTTFRPSRKRGASGSSSTPGARVLLLDGATRGIRTVLADLESPGPRPPLLIAGDAVVACGSVLRAWSIDDGSTLADRHWTDDLVVAAAVLGEARIVATTGPHGTVLIADTETWDTVGGWPAHDAEARAIAVAPGAGELATGGDDGLVRRWSPDGALIDEANLEAPVEAAAYDGTGRHLVVAIGGPAPAVVELDLER